MNSQTLKALQQVQVYLEYDPVTNWSAVEYHEQSLLRSVVTSIPEEKLSVGFVLQKARLPNTPSRVQWVKSLIVHRFCGHGFF